MPVKREFEYDGLMVRMNPSKTGKAWVVTVTNPQNGHVSHSKSIREIDEGLAVNKAVEFARKCHASILKTGLMA